MNRTRAVALTELVLTGTPAEVALLADIAARSGRLVHTSTPKPMGGTDPRIRIRLLLDPIP
ncbi:MAG TPA: hypothetical protein VFB74_02260 [Kribbellaceae bacterium]|nr:hypothetical protein [Kribbellaceae bacterium]